MSNTHYFVPKHRNYAYAINIIREQLNKLPIDWNAEYKAVINKITTPKEVQDTEFIEENDAPSNGAHLIRIMEALPDGGDKNDLPEDIRPKSGYGNTYAKMWWHRPAPTITRNFACPSSSRCVHPRDSRAMTTREGARLQSFPDSYKFYGSRQTKNLEIGNAVPPLLSIALAKQMAKFFKK